jgi:nicotinate-nucleotide adenylyltransferase
MAWPAAGERGGLSAARIAFFGGTFDPPHRGHLAVARAAAERFRLDRVLFAPVARQPLKAESRAASILDRFAMVALATAEDPRFVASQIDAVERGEPNFTVDALARLRDAEPEAKVFALAGADAFQGIAEWRSPEKLLAMCDWIVAARPGYSLDALEGSLPPEILAEPLDSDPEGEGLLLLHEGDATTRVLLLMETKEDVSATQVRAGVGAVTGQHGWQSRDVPEIVADYIRKTGLYQR